MHDIKLWRAATNESRDLSTVKCISQLFLVSDEIRYVKRRRSISPVPIDFFSACLKSVYTVDVNRTASTLCKMITVRAFLEECMDFTWFDLNDHLQTCNDYVNCFNEQGAWAAQPFNLLQRHILRPTRVHCSEEELARPRDRYMHFTSQCAGAAFRPSANGTRRRDPTTLTRPPRSPIYESIVVNGGARRNRSEQAVADHPAAAGRIASARLDCGKWTPDASAAVNAITRWFWQI